MRPKTAIIFHRNVVSSFTPMVEAKAPVATTAHRPRAWETRARLGSGWFFFGKPWSLNVKADWDEVHLF